MDMTPEEIEENDKQQIKRIFEFTGAKFTDKDISATRDAMLKAIALKQVAASTLVDDEDKDQELLVAIYTSALCSLLK